MIIQRQGSLFSGIGGLELGLERVLGCETAWQVEQDEKCRRVLARHWPDAYRGITDVRLANRSTLSPVDLLCGGFPCQDVSSAGKGAGLAGARSGLWYEFWRVAEELRPAWIVVENVASGARRWLPHVRRDLHVLGYLTHAVQVSAFDCGAPHRRERVFVLAADPERVELRDESGWRGRTRGAGSHVAPDDGQARAAADADRKGQLQPGGGVSCFWGWARDGGGWTAEPPVPGVAHGVRGRVDRERQLGNAVSPEQSAAVGRMILSLLRRSEDR